MYHPICDKFSPNSEKNNIYDSIRIYEYEGWSLNNTRNHLNWFNEGSQVICFVSKEEINDLEVWGLEKLIAKSSSIWQGLDLNINIYRGKYNKTCDCIFFDKDYDIFYKKHIYDCDKILNEFQKKDKLLEESKDIICIESFTTLRSKMSKWERFWNKRKCIINNYGIRGE